MVVKRRSLAVWSSRSPWRSRGGRAQDAHVKDAQVKDAPITWSVYVYAPPYMMTEGENRDAGIFDRIRRLLSERLTGYTIPR